MKPIKSLLLLLALIGSSQAATINLSSGGIAIKDKNGDLLSSGAVRLGFFSTYSAAGITNFTTALANTNTAEVKSYIAANFIPIAEPGANVKYGVQSAAGANGLLAIKPNTPSGTEPANSSTISGTIASSDWVSGTANTVDPNGLVRGTRLFLLVYNDTDIERATSLGIYSATAWTLSTNTLITALSASLSAVDDVAGTGTAKEFFRGTSGSLVLGDFTPVPEPATFSVLALGAMVALRRKRR